jgi:H+/Cl- antiporter ClcA
VIVLEMTGDHGNVIPLMTAAMLGYGTARLPTPKPLYHALSRRVIADAPGRRGGRGRRGGSEGRDGIPGR